jgi:hypothetical protein
MFLQPPAVALKLDAVRVGPGEELVTYEGPEGDVVVVIVIVVTRTLR